MIISQSGIIDLVPEYNRQLRPIFCVSEGDADSRMINLTVQNAGELFTIPEGANVYIAGRKLDNTIFTYECSYSGYIVSFPILEQMSAVSGLVLCELQIIVDGDPLGSANFCFWVEPSPVENGTTSESDLNIMSQAIAALGGYDYLTGEVATLSARMDQFARLPDGSLSTAADAELADIRVETNGKTATTAGDAVREQITNVREEFAELSPGYVVGNNLFDYNNAEPGDISATGAETVNDNIRRTIKPVPISGEYVISNYPCRKIFYNSVGTFISRSASTSNAVAIPEGAAFVRFSISKTNYEAHTDIMANVGQTVLSYEPFWMYREIDAESFDGALTASDLNTQQKFYDQLYKVFKRVGVCGDSMSVGYTKNPVTQETLTRNLPYSWVKCVGRDANSYWLNFGTTGQNVLTWCSSATYGKVQMETENNKCQAYIIGLGQNDINDIPVGTPSDIVNDPDVVATTYYGGYARIIQLIKRRNADAKIFCFTNPKENSTAKPFNDAVRYIAETYYTTADNVFLVDLYKDYGVLFTEGHPLYVDKQAVSHYSSVGYQMLSKINEEAISRVMLKNQLSFLTVPFIPYDTAEPTPDTMTE